jgi:hypothetical protein
MMRGKHIIIQTEENFKIVRGTKLYMFKEEKIHFRSYKAGWIHGRNRQKKIISGQILQNLC